MTAFLTLLAIAFDLLVFDAHADSKTICANATQIWLRNLLEETPSTIKMDRSLKGRDGEKTFAGFFVQPNKGIPHLDDGVYIYLIDQEGFIAISKRVPDLSDVVRPIATHRSLVAEFRKRYNRYPKVIAPGEFEIIQGRVAHLNNRSEYFAADGTHLKFAEKALSKAYLPITVRTERADFAVMKYANNFEFDVQQARALVEMNQDPRRYKILRKSILLRKKLAEAYPSKLLNRFDPMAFLNSSELRLASNIKGSKFLRVPSEDSEVLALHLLETMNKPREVEFELNRLINERGFPRVEDAMNSLLNYEGLLRR